MTETSQTELFPIVLLDNMAYAYGQPQFSAKFKQSPEDFQVNETLSFDIEGEGTHAYLYIRKTDTNTQWLAKQLANFSGIPVRDVGYAGLKDRHAVTRQWFSINLEGIEEPDWQQLDIPGIAIEQHRYHKRKLKTGAIAHNEFIIQLKALSKDAKPTLIESLEKIKQQGVPNYFGSQRFGIDNGNLTKAKAWFSGQRKVKRREEKSIYLSASRSMLFNHLLSLRINEYGWNQLVEGEVMMLDGSHAVFKTEELDNELQERFDKADIHPTICLWGRGEPSSNSKINQLELSLRDNFSDWCQTLENKGLKQERRSIRLIPQNLQYQFQDDNSLKLQFNLPTGSYATALLRELVTVYG